MKILLINNFYQQAGGENSWFHTEKNLLETFGHEVITYTRHNDEILDYSLWQKLSLPRQTVWASDSYSDISRLIEQQKPEIAHFTNTFPLISPAAYYACQHHNVPVVQSLHNYRILCPAATFYRNGRLCESCLDKTVPWPAVWHQCYHDSAAQTAVIASMLTFHNLLQTWTRQVSRFIALTQFSRQKFIQAGLPPKQIEVKPNFLLKDPGFTLRSGEFALFVGRLVPEKGILTLLKAWEDIPFPLKIIGNGPLLAQIEPLIAANTKNIQYDGWQPHDKVMELMARARFLIVPSEWYEGLPMTIVEAFASGLPVIASRLGSLEGLISHGETGLLFTPGSVEQLNQTVLWALANQPALEEFTRNSRMTFENNYTAERNYQLLMNIYQRVIKSA